MSHSAQFLNPSEAARRLGVSAKALRLYEQRDLVVPVRTAAGWRTYGPTQMARAAEIAALRALGLSLAQVAKVLKGDPECLEPALAAHQATLEGHIRQLAHTIQRVRAVRVGLARGEAPAAAELARLVQPAAEVRVAFDLPWPWGGEKFELCNIRSLNYIIGPLGSGKTRLAHTIAENLPGATFLGLERLADGGVEARARMIANPALKSRVDQSLAWLVEDGAVVSCALTALLVALDSEDAATLVVDMVEQGLDLASQQGSNCVSAPSWPRCSAAFLAHAIERDPGLERRRPRRSDHPLPCQSAPPTQVAPYPGAPGYEAVATCLASPEVRARTEGVIAWRPQVA